MNQNATQLGTAFRKKPVQVTACQWTGANADELAEFTGGRFVALAPEDRGDDPDKSGSVLDELHSTWVLMGDGDWIIRGVQGEFYPCRPDVFEATYEPV